MANKKVKRISKTSSASKRATEIQIRSSYMSLIKMINLRGDEYPSDAKLDSFDYCNKLYDTSEKESFNKLHNILLPLKIVPVTPGDRTCH